MLDYLIVLTFVLFVIILVQGMSKQIRDKKEKREEQEKLRQHNITNIVEQVSKNGAVPQAREIYKGEDTELSFEQISKKVLDIQDIVNLPFEKLYSLLLVIDIGISRDDLKKILGLKDEPKVRGFKDAKTLSDTYVDVDNSLEFTIIEIQKIAFLPFEDLYKALLLLGYDLSQKQLQSIIHHKKIDMRDKEEFDKAHKDGALKVKIKKLPNVHGEQKYIFLAFDINDRLILSDVYDAKSEANFSNFMNKCMDKCPFNITGINSNINDGFVSKFARLNNLKILTGMHFAKMTYVSRNLAKPLSDFEESLHEKLDVLNDEHKQEILDNEFEINRLEELYQQDENRFNLEVDNLVSKFAVTVAVSSFDVEKLREMFLVEHQDVFKDLKEKLDIKTVIFEALDDTKFNQIKNNVQDNENSFVKRPFILHHDKLYINEDKLGKFSSLDFAQDSSYGTFLPFLTTFFRSALLPQINELKTNKLDIGRVKEILETNFKVDNQDTTKKELKLSRAISSTIEANFRADDKSIFEEKNHDARSGI